MRRFARRLIDDRRGVAAIEFAFVAPVLVLIFAGVVEVCEALSAQRRVNQIAATTADLIAQSETLSTSSASDIFAADTVIVSPYDSSALSVLACAVYTNTAGAQVVRWCKAYNDTALSAGAPSPAAIDTAVMRSDEDMVVVRVRYTFSSPFTSLLAIRSTYSLSRVYFERPRVSSTITAS